MALLNTLTAGQLITLLQKVPADTQVTIDVCDMPENSEFANISGLELPDFDESFSVILMAADTFDARQF